MLFVSNLVKIVMFRCNIYLRYCLFVCIFFSSHSRIFHSYGDVTITSEGLQILTYAWHSWPLRSEGSLTCHTYCDTGHSFIMVISEEPWHSHILPSVWQWNVTTCFYYLGLSRLGFEHPTFRKRGKRSNPLHHRRGYLLYNTYTYCKINVKLMSLFYPYMYI